MKHFPLLCLFVAASTLLGAPAQARGEKPAPKTERPSVRFSVIKTSQVAVVERLLVPGGSLTKKVATNFSAFLVQHNQDYILLDTGLGDRIDTQYQRDMPYWMRPFFKYETPVHSARKQLDAAGIGTINKIILSHSHWDHASGILDYPQAPVLVAAEELPVIHNAGGAGGAWPSQVGNPATRWTPVAFTSGPYKGYDTSLDLYQDGTVVLVPMPGHTPGSIGVFVTVGSGKCYFFIGDVAWRLAALQADAPKFWAASVIVDHDRKQTRDSVRQVHTVMQQYPDVAVVPAHDSAVQDTLGYFPHWVK